MFKFNSYKSMKNVLTLLFASVIFLTSCSKKKTDEVSPSEEKESFSTKINGILFSPDVANVYIDTFMQSGKFITQIIAEQGDKSLVLQFNGKIANTYTQAAPNDHPMDVAIYTVGSDSTFICSNSVGGGTLTISKYDIANGKVSGTFNFNAEYFFGNELKTFTEGAFVNVNIQ